MPKPICPQWPDRQAYATALRAAALQAVDPAAAVCRFMLRQNDTLHIAGRDYSLRQRQTFIVGAGKAAGPMVSCAADLVGTHLSGAIVVTQYGHIQEPRHHVARRPYHLLEAGHPTPDEAGIRATRWIVELLSTVQEGDLILALFSGGGSSLMTMPIDGIALADLQELTTLLLKSGATINEINTLRKHLDVVKGGGLARIITTRGAEVIALILSDVVGDALDVIASGPTAPDHSTYQDALDVLARYNLLEPAAHVADVLRAGAAGRIPETPKPGDALFQRVRNVIVGSNSLAAEAATAEAETLGFHTLLMTTQLQGEAREVARVVAAIVSEIALKRRPLTVPACLVFGGETTVTVRGQGHGGRNQELALALAIALDGLPHVQAVTFATDGIDGFTDAAGATITGDTVARARARGLNPLAYLAENDSYTFFEKTGELLKTGPTHTNVNDLLFVQVYP